ncbi:uncharacterized protein DNG_05934 [Cephalotrichum gorgonifer]|uniref:Uncharacterized protein n=1 Tax=Cephalotrichum gorgonifer TaxID=2041049 RepID=A0AAE8N1T3_9PEZI|nr:uncharacterized protein DNG_05934 [Cephalotrichum gorgonifer]
MNPNTAAMAGQQTSDGPQRSIGAPKDDLPLHIEGIVDSVRSALLERGSPDALKFTYDFPRAANASSGIPGDVGILDELKLILELIPCEMPMEDYKARLDQLKSMFKSYLYSRYREETGRRHGYRIQADIEAYAERLKVLCTEYMSTNRTIAESNQAVDGAVETINAEESIAGPRKTLIELEQATGMMFSWKGTKTLTMQCGSPRQNILLVTHRLKRRRVQLRVCEALHRLTSKHLRKHEGDSWAVAQCVGRTAPWFGDEDVRMNGVICSQVLSEMTRRIELAEREMELSGRLSPYLDLDESELGLFGQASFLE